MAFGVLEKRSHCPKVFVSYTRLKNVSGRKPSKRRIKDDKIEPAINIFENITFFEYYSGIDPIQLCIFPRTSYCKGINADGHYLGGI